MDDTTPGDRLEKARKAAGLSVRALAAKARINYSYITKIERGTAENVSLRIFEALARSLDIPVGALTGEEPLPRPATLDDVVAKLDLVLVALDRLASGNRASPPG
jgi:transcriptional regulator with XRE-family HTH domain